MTLTPPTIPAEVAAAAEQARAAAREQDGDPSAPWGRDHNGRPNVPGFASEQVVPDEDLRTPAATLPEPEGGSKVRREDYKNVQDYHRAKFRAGEIVI